MNRCLFVGLMVALLAFSGSVRDGFAQSAIVDEALTSVATAESAVADAKAAINEPKATTIAPTPEDTRAALNALTPDVAEAKPAPIPPANPGAPGQSCIQHLPLRNHRGKY